MRCKMIHEKSSFGQVMTAIHQVMVALLLVMQTLINYLFSKAAWVMHYLSGYLHVNKDHLILFLAVVGLWYLVIQFLKMVDSLFSGSVSHGDPAPDPERQWINHRLYQDGKGANVAGGDGESSP